MHLHVLWLLPKNIGAHLNDFSTKIMGCRINPLFSKTIPSNFMWTIWNSTSRLPYQCTPNMNVKLNCIKRLRKEEQKIGIKILIWFWLIIRGSDSFCVFRIYTIKCIFNWTEYGIYIFSILIILRLNTLTENL